MKNKLLHTLLCALSFLAVRMSVYSLSEISTGGWYQPEIDESLIQKRR